MNQRIRLTINDKAKQLFQKLGVGTVNYIEIYREEGNKIYFKAGNGRFHVTKEELADYQ